MTFFGSVEMEKEFLLAEYRRNWRKKAWQLRESDLWFGIRHSSKTPLEAWRDLRTKCLNTTGCSSEYLAICEGVIDRLERQEKLVKPRDFELNLVR